MATGLAYGAFPSFAFGFSALGMGVAIVGFAANPSLCTGLALFLAVAGGSGGNTPLNLPQGVLAVTNRGGTLALTTTTVQVQVGAIPLSVAMSGLPVMFAADDDGGGGKPVTKKSNTTGELKQPPSYPEELRNNMEKAGISKPPDYVNPQAHHNFPWVFKDWFARHGIYVHDFDFGRWVEGAPPGPHQIWSRT